ncbi:MAG: N-acetylmuramoyl-L-alanine amidase [Granulosicoccus sp.]
MRDSDFVVALFVTRFFRLTGAVASAVAHGRLLVPGIRLAWLLALMMCILPSLTAAAVKLHDFKMVQQDNLMLHFDLDSAEASVDMFTLNNPHRLVIDLPNAILGTQLPTEEFDTGVVKAVRYAQHGEHYLRVVLDLRRQVSPTSRIVARPGGQRLIVNMGVSAGTALVDRGRIINEEQPPRDVVIAIDAGHGGRDPGAIGPSNTYEKNVVLAVAIRLHNQLVGVRGITPVLTRDSDVYIDLRERMNLARQANADIFVSIHADAINRESAHGSSVYALSMDGATSEAAAWLAKSENEAAALYGDVAISGLEGGLAQTLINLTQGNTMERSIEVGTDVLSELGKLGPVHKATVEQAAFAVLKSPDIPSILVETAFISNRAEEIKLNSPDYQEQLAVAIAKGLYRYLQKRAPVDTWLAQERRSNGS